MTRIVTSPDPGAGTGSSTTASTSGPPNAVASTTFAMVALPDHRLGAQHRDQREALGVLAAGLGRVDHHAQVATGGAEDVAVQRHGTDVRVVDGLVRPLVAADGAGLPQLGEPRAVRA